MPGPTVVISEFMDEPAVALIAERHPTIYDATLVDHPDKLGALLGEAKVLVVRNRTMVRPSLLDRAPKLVAVGRLGVGLDNIDVDACAARGIEVRPATGANTDSVAEYVVAAVLMLARGGAYHATAEMTAGAWPRNRLIGGEVGGKVLALIGYGAIARAVGFRAKALGLRVVAHDPLLAADDPAWASAERLDRDGVLAVADFVSLHVPLTPGTRHLIDAAAIARMKRGAAIINTSRGGVVDEAAVVAGLKAGYLGGAALDVFETEPLDGAAGGAFAGVPNLLLTPHIAGVTRESNERVSAVIADFVLEKLAEARGAKP